MQSVYVSGWFRPQLRMEWSDLALFNSRTVLKTCVTNTVRLTWNQAKALKNILQQNYYVLPVIIGRCEIIYAEWTMAENATAPPASAINLRDGIEMPTQQAPTRYTLGRKPPIQPATYKDLA